MSTQPRTHYQRKSVKGILLKPCDLDGSAQMATDEIMLNKAILDPELSLLIRFYSWDGPWLSIGHNQKDLPASWVELVRNKELNLVRRPSGGKAVLHAGGITYALAWRSPPKKKHQAYLEASQWIINCFKKLGLTLKFGLKSPKQLSENCFASATSADLVDDQNYKRVGSAQFWRRGSVLQHGEILLTPPEDLWGKIFNTKPPKPLKNCPQIDELISLLFSSIVSYWPEVKWQKESLSSKDLIQIKTNSKNYLL